MPLLPEAIRLAIPESWQKVLPMEALLPCLRSISNFLTEERREGYTFYPAVPDIFKALELTPPEAVKAVILGQDPYHSEDQAHGLSFSVRPGVKAPPSLANIFTEYQYDLGFVKPHPRNGDLTAWANQGVLLLNTALTVRAGTPMSHNGIGWGTITDAILNAVKAKPEGVVVIFWGIPAQSRARIFEGTHHKVLKAPHPSPLSSYRGFFGSRPFSLTNEALQAFGRTPIQWALPSTRPGESFQQASAPALL